MSVVHWALSPGGRPACGRGSRPQVQTAVEQCKVTCSWCRREIEREPVTCRAERQVAAVREVLAEIEGDTVPFVALPFASSVAKRIRAALEVE